MKVEKLIRFALVQVGVILAVAAVVPTIGVIALILTSTIASLFCEQLGALMTLSVLVTASVLAVKKFRGDIAKS